MKSYQKISLSAFVMLLMMANLSHAAAPKKESKEAAATATSGSSSAPKAKASGSSAPQDELRKLNEKCKEFIKKIETKTDDAEKSKIPEFEQAIIRNLFIDFDKYVVSRVRPNQLSLEKMLRIFPEIESRFNDTSKKIDDIITDIKKAKDREKKKAKKKKQKARESSSAPEIGAAAAPTSLKLRRAGAAGGSDKKSDDSAAEETSDQKIYRELKRLYLELENITARIIKKYPNAIFDIPPKMPDSLPDISLAKFIIQSVQYSIDKLDKLEADLDAQHKANLALKTPKTSHAHSSGAPKKSSSSSSSSAPKANAAAAAASVSDSKGKNSIPEASHQKIRQITDEAYTRWQNKFGDLRRKFPAKAAEINEWEKQAQAKTAAQTDWSLDSDTLTQSLLDETDKTFRDLAALEAQFETELSSKSPEASHAISSPTPKKAGSSSSSEAPKIGAAAPTSLKLRRAGAAVASDNSATKETLAQQTSRKLMELIQELAAKRTYLMEKYPKAGVTLWESIKVPDTLPTVDISDTLIAIKSLKAILAQLGQLELQLDRQHQVKLIEAEWAAQDRAKLKAQKTLGEFKITILVMQITEALIKLKHPSKAAEIASWGDTSEFAPDTLTEEMIPQIRQTTLGLKKKLADIIKIEAKFDAEARQKARSHASSSPAPKKSGSNSSSAGPKEIGSAAAAAASSSPDSKKNQESSDAVLARQIADDNADEDNDDDDMRAAILLSRQDKVDSLLNELNEAITDAQKERIDTIQSFIQNASENGLIYDTTQIDILTAIHLGSMKFEKERLEEITKHLRASLVIDQNYLEEFTNRLEDTNKRLHDHIRHIETTARNSQASTPSASLSSLSSPMPAAAAAAAAAPITAPTAPVIVAAASLAALGNSDSKRSGEDKKAAEETKAAKDNPAPRIVTQPRPESLLQPIQRKGKISFNRKDIFVFMDIFDKNVAHAIKYGDIELFDECCAYNNNVIKKYEKQYHKDAQIEIFDQEYLDELLHDVLIKTSLDKINAIAQKLITMGAKVTLNTFYSMKESRSDDWITLTPFFIAIYSKQLITPTSRNLISADDADNLIIIKDYIHQTLQENSDHLIKDELLSSRTLINSILVDFLKKTPSPNTEGLPNLQELLNYIKENSSKKNETHTRKPKAPKKGSKAPKQKTPAAGGAQAAASSSIIPLVALLQANKENPHCSGTLSFLDRALPWLDRTGTAPDPHTPPHLDIANDPYAGMPLYPPGTPRTPPGMPDLPPPMPAAASKKVAIDRKSVAELSDDKADDLAKKFSKKKSFDFLNKMFIWRNNKLPYSLPYYLAFGGNLAQLQELSFDKEPDILRCPATIAARNGRFDIVDWLIAHDRAASSRLHYACMAGNLEEIQHCIEVLNIDTNNKNPEKLTPLEVALYFSSPNQPDNLSAIFKYLTNGAKVQAIAQRLFFIKALIKKQQEIFTIFINSFAINEMYNLVMNLIPCIRTNYTNDIYRADVVKFAAADKVTPEVYVDNIVKFLQKTLEDLSTRKKTGAIPLAHPTSPAENPDGKEEKKRMVEVPAAPKEPKSDAITPTRAFEIAIRQGNYEAIMHAYKMSNITPDLKDKFEDHLVGRIILQAPMDNDIICLKNLITKNNVKITLEHLILLNLKYEGHDEKLSLLIQLSSKYHHQILSEATTIFSDESLHEKYINDLPIIEKIIRCLRSLLVD